MNREKGGGVELDDKIGIERKRERREGGGGGDDKNEREMN